MSIFAKKLAGIRNAKSGKTSVFFWFAAVFLVILVEMLFMSEILSYCYNTTKDSRYDQWCREYFERKTVEEDKLNEICRDKDVFVPTENRVLRRNIGDNKTVSRVD